MIGKLKSRLLKPSKMGSLKKSVLAGIAVIVGIPVCVSLASGNAATDSQNGLLASTNHVAVVSAKQTLPAATSQPVISISTQPVASATAQNTTPITTTSKTTTQTTPKATTPANTKAAAQTTTKATTKATTKTTANTPISYTVYITKTGEKYHSSGCRYLSKSKIAISKDDAVKRGYDPCSVCTS